MVGYILWQYTHYSGYIWWPYLEFRGVFGGLQVAWNPPKRHFYGKKRYSQLLKHPIPPYLVAVSRELPLSFILASITGYGGPLERSRGQKTGHNGPKYSNKVSKLLQIIQANYGRAHCVMIKYLFRLHIVVSWTVKGIIVGTMSGPKCQNAIFTRKEIVGLIGIFSCRWKQ